MPVTDKKDLKEKIERQARRMKKAELEHPTLIAQTVYIGTLGLLFVLPIIAGAYIGHWIDNQISGYSVEWTTSLIIVGVLIGGINVYLFIRE